MPIRERKQRSHSINLGEVSDEEKKKKGKITTNENDEEARVDFQVYKAYQSFQGGCKQIFIL